MNWIKKIRRSIISAAGLMISFPVARCQCLSNDAVRYKHDCWLFSKCCCATIVDCIFFLFACSNLSVSSILWLWIYCRIYVLHWFIVTFVFAFIITSLFAFIYCHFYLLPNRHISGLHSLHWHIYVSHLLSYPCFAFIYCHICVMSNCHISVLHLLSNLCFTIIIVTSKFSIPHLIYLSSHCIPGT